MRLLLFALAFFSLLSAEISSPPAWASPPPSSRPTSALKPPSTPTSTPAPTPAPTPPPLTAPAPSTAPSPVSSNLSKESQSKIRKVIRETMTMDLLPGLALGITTQDRTLWAEGFGFRDLQKRLPVTQDTLFAIGSTTKAFTATLVGLLLKQQGRSWETPIREILPDFRLRDRVAQEEMTTLDLLAHRSGLPRHDFVWYGAANKTRKAIYETLHTLPSQRGFRQAVLYNNLMYMVAGVVSEALSGLSWEEALHRFLLQPLGMKRTTPFERIFLASPDRALPYAWFRGNYIPLSLRKIDAIGPAGSIFSSVTEMLSWLRLQMNQGRYAKAVVVPPDVLATVHSPHVVLPSGGPMASADFSPLTYGLGWMILQYRGDRIIFHNGQIDGFSALVGFLPHQNLGLVLLTNQTNFPTIIGFFFDLLDILRGRSNRSIALQMKLSMGKASAAYLQASKAPPSSKAKPPSPLSHPIDAFVGRYFHPAYGEIRLSLSPKKHVEARFHRFEMLLRHLHSNTFTIQKAREGSLPAFFLSTYLSFPIDLSGKINVLHLHLPGHPPVHFLRQ